MVGGVVDDEDCQNPPETKSVAYDLRKLVERVSQPVAKKPVLFSR